MLPKAPLRPRERVLLAGAVELKATLADLEARPALPSVTLETRSYDRSSPGKD